MVHLEVTSQDKTTRASFHTPFLSCLSLKRSYGRYTSEPIKPYLSPPSDVEVL